MLRYGKKYSKIVAFLWEIWYNVVSVKSCEIVWFEQNISIVFFDFREN